MSSPDQLDLPLPEPRAEDPNQYHFSFYEQPKNDEHHATDSAPIKNVPEEMFSNGSY